MDDIELGPLERSWGTAVKASPTGSCPTAAEWIEFVERAESADCYSRAILHLAQCLECRQTVQEMRAAELASITAQAPSRNRSPLFGLLRPLTLAGAAGVLAFGSAIMVIRWQSSAGSTGEVAKFSPAPNTHSTLPAPSKPAAGLDGSVVARRSNRTGTTPAGSHPNDIDDPSAPATDQQYCLIGSDGVFTMPSPDFKLKDRQRIEEAYADRVDVARKQYDAKTGAKGDPDDATAQLNQDLESAAEERDQKLGTIYQKRDEPLDKTLNLKLEAGTPYQVVEVDYKVRRSLKQPVKVVVHQPWPGYSPSRRPFGWDYETPYEPTEFKSRYVDWRKSYVSAGRPAFCGLVGHAGAVRVDTIFGSRYEGYAASREIARHRATFGAGSPDLGGYTHSSMPGQGSAVPGSTWSGYTHSPSPGPRAGAAQGTDAGTNPRGDAGSPNRNAPPSGYRHSQSSDVGGYTHSQNSPSEARTAPSIGGYTHSTRGQQPKGSSAGRDGGL